MPETEDSISAMQLKLKYNTDVAVQDNAAQHCAILVANTISNTGKIAKMVYIIQILLVKMVVGTLITNSDSEN